MKHTRRFHHAFLVNESISALHKTTSIKFYLLILISFNENPYKLIEVAFACDKYVYGARLVRTTIVYRYLPHERYENRLQHTHRKITIRIEKM